eukprot:2401046-Prymnesium_polylepis.1
MVRWWRPGLAAELRVVLVACPSPPLVDSIIPRSLFAALQQGTRGCSLHRKQGSAVRHGAALLAM